jgi:hypothetical protein
VNKSESNNIKTTRIVSIVLLFIVAINALAAGYSFMVEPSGKDIGITTDYLRPSAPFKDYFIPGIVLFSVNGVLSLLVAVLAIKKHSHYPLFICMQGVIFMGWILIQLTMVTTFHPLHFIIGLTGMLLAAAGWYMNRQMSIRS